MMNPIRYSSVELLVVLCLLFVTAPFVEDLPHGSLVETILMTVVMMSSVLAVGGRRTSLIVALILLVPALLGKWITHLHSGLLHPAFYLVAFVIFSGFVVARLLSFTVHARQVDANVLCAGVAGFLLLGLAWVPAYLAVARATPHAFTLPVAAGGVPAVLDGSSAFYFSFVTLCTVGYGDIAPVSKVARMLAVTEAITGLFYIAVLLSRLVSMYSNTQSHSGSGLQIHNQKPKEPNADGQS
ncbi:MAG: hypothetical protein AYP45_12655 [Candidatus Brocadia carolinensis]|uniref:Potassium channel domain-containing protein n=1 Tax=Candidatus Brocadia carolinensis TaxID=1004156 RepID=A0A1V4ARP0_9BACT|nr:MAG: hypothetical protein AYP45_12655 [Candidatus Brocadia caroliniensis]